MKEATGRQLQVLRFVSSFSAERGYAPTMREIGKALGMDSTNAVNDHVAALERKGYVRRGKMTARSIVVLRGADGGTKQGGSAAWTPADLLERERMSYRLGVEKAEEALTSCAEHHIRRQDGTLGVMVDLAEALRKIRELLKAGGA